MFSVSVMAAVGVLFVGTIGNQAEAAQAEAADAKPAPDRFDVQNKDFWENNMDTSIPWIITLKEDEEAWANRAVVKERLEEGGVNVSKAVNFGMLHFGMVVVQATPAEALTFAEKWLTNQTVLDFLLTMVDHIEPVLPVRGSDINSQRLKRTSQWGLDALSPPLDGTYEYSATGKGVEVYVFDTGILGSHKEFQNEDGTSRASTVWNYFEDEEATDLNGHGTHVAGIVGGNTFGVAKDVILKGVKVLDAEGGGNTQAIVEGLKAVVDEIQVRVENGEDPRIVLNFSLGGPFSALLDAIMNLLYKYSIPVIVAAGNEDVDACTSSPAASRGVLTVGASTVTGIRHDFSNWGGCVNIFAPGDAVSAYIPRDDSTAILAGTSQATPFVAGLVALILEERKVDTGKLVEELDAWSSSSLNVNTLKNSPNVFAASPYTSNTEAVVVVWATPEEIELVQVLSFGVIIAIVFGSLCCVGLTILACCKIYQDSQSKRQENETAANASAPSTAESAGLKAGENTGGDTGNV